MTAAVSVKHSVHISKKVFVFGFFEAKSKKEAIEEAKLYFADPSYICEFTEAEAEASGLDEY